MQRDFVVKGRGLGGSADLTLTAPIRAGFIESLESVTYKTRIKRVLEALHGARTSAHEYQPVRLLSDAVERVGAIQSVRVAVLEPEDKVLLAVTFDGSWEAYIRVLWEKVGTLLDLIFCGTEGYVTAAEHSFDEWEAWARRVQVETGFYYGPPNATARDVIVHTRTEAMRMRAAIVPPPPEAKPTRCDSGAVAELRASAPGAELTMKRLLSLQQPMPDDPQPGGVNPVRMVRERMRNGLQGLAGLYRLADLHPPGTPDGEVLRRAALELLLEFVQAHDARLIRRLLQDERANGRFARQLAWLLPSDDQPAQWVRPRPAPPAQDRLPPELRARIQGGIVRPYGGVSHGVVLLLALPDAGTAAAFLGWLRGRVNSDAAADYAKPVHFNVGFTPQGLRAAGLGDDELDLFPEEFRVGMAARNGVLGDLHDNHPRRWRLPRAFDSLDRPRLADQAIELDAVHAVLQLRTTAGDEAQAAAVDIDDPQHPLRGELQAFMQALPSVRILSCIGLKRRFETRADDNGQPQTTIVEHFGYADGNGQPDIERPATPFDRNRIHLGEIVHGYDNASDAAIDPEDRRYPEAVRERERWLADGSFMVMRQYRQFVGRLEQAVEATAVDMHQRINAADHPLALCREIVYGKLMGRLRNGAPMVDPTRTDPATQNVFDYADDPQGLQCPINAHVRKGNPRNAVAGERAPRLMRRSMSYGPERAPGSVGDDDAERGLLFMAYNADIGQQFEVVQRWLVGGNPTGASSAQRCPVLGVASGGEARLFRFEYRGEVYSVQLAPTHPMFDPSPDPVRLLWGLYLFAPSLAVLERLHTSAGSAAARAPAQPVPWDLAHGRRQLARLLALQAQADEATVVQAWKAAVEDPEAIDRLDAAALWAAIRADHQGLLRTPYGVLVAERDLIHDVYRDRDERYSVSGQLERMKNSFGEISLGLDRGPEYEQQSEPINTRIGELTEAQTYELAFNAATALIQGIVDRAISQSKDAGDARFEVGLDTREVAEEVLATLSEAWFELDASSGFFRRGPMDWAWQPGQPPLYPGHFTALSRYMFQPRPGPLPVELGQRYGQALRTAMRGFVAFKRARGGFQAPLARAIFEHPDFGHDDDFVARNMVGVLMGFNPTIIGAVLNVMREWQRDGSFARLRPRLIGRSAFDDVSPWLDAPLAAAARMRPMPQLGWRTVRRPHRLGPAGDGGIDLQTGDRVVLANVSGTQQSQADGQDDHRIMFGGRRAPKNDHPTHACPGYVAGIGAIKGTLAAILSRPENLRPGSAALAFVIDGPSGLAPTVPPAAPAALAVPVPAAKSAPYGASADSQPMRQAGLLLAAATASAGRVLGWGDSWLDYRLPELGIDVGQDLRDWLASPGDPFGFTAPKDFCLWTEWPLIEVMADNPAPFCEFLGNELALRRPRAILLSGGGNDSTEGSLAALINRKGTAAEVLNPDLLRAHLDRLHGHYVTVLGALRQVFVDKAVDPVPVIVHGYDHPLPRGAGRPLPIKRWLFKPFLDAGYDCTQADDLKAASAAMRELIQGFNQRLARLKPQDGFEFVHHVDLTGTIEAAFQNAGDGWANDLHPTDEGFRLLAAKIAAKVRELPA